MPWPTYPGAPGAPQIIGTDALPGPGLAESIGLNPVIGRPPDGMLQAYPRTGFAKRGIPEPYAPDKFRPEKAEANPLYSVPGPLATERRGFWHMSDQQAVWTTSPDDATLLRCQWQTPIFDLRPDQRGASANATTTAFPVFRGSAYGAGARCIFSILRTNGASIQDLTQDVTAYSIERAHVDNDLLVGVSQVPEDISVDLWNSTTVFTAVFTPPAYPIRYWAVIVRFEVPLDVEVSAPPFTAYAVCQ